MLKEDRVSLGRCHNLTSPMKHQPHLSAHPVLNDLAGSVVPWKFALETRSSQVRAPT
jgi:hypothetical protein